MAAAHLEDGMRKFAGTLLTGLLAITPFAVTIGLIAFVVDALYGFVGPESTIGQWLLAAEEALAIPRYISYPASVVLVILVIWAIGNMARLYIGRRFRQWAEAMIGKIPLINKIYSSVDQVLDLVTKRDSSTGPALTNVVVARIANTQILGLLAGTEPININGVPHYLIYMPNLPVPTTGNAYLIPCSDVLDVDLSAEELTRIMVSLGSLGPGIMNKKQPLVVPGRLNAVENAGV
jgi:uncharacterized membrane protein